MAYASAVVAGTGLLAFPLMAVGSSPSTLSGLEVAFLSLLFALLGGVLYSILLSPVVLFGGSLVGVFDGAVVRRSVREGLLPRPDRDREPVLTRR